MDLLRLIDQMEFEYTLRFDFKAWNNQVECESLLAGSSGRSLPSGSGQAGDVVVLVHGDSKLVVRQVLSEYEAKRERMEKPTN
jgi:ribonuclease HI